MAFRSEATKAGRRLGDGGEPLEARGDPVESRREALRGLHAALGEWRHVGQPQVGSEQLRFPPGLPEHVLVVDVELAVEVVDGGRDLRHRLARGPGLGHIPLQRAAERRFAVPDRVSDGVGGRPALREGAHPGDVVRHRHGGEHVGDLLLETAAGLDRDGSRVAELLLSDPGLEEVGHLVEEHPAVQHGRHGLGLEERGAQGGHRVDLPSEGRPPDGGIARPGGDLVRRPLDLAAHRAHERAHPEPGLVGVHRHAHVGPAVDLGSAHGHGATDARRREGDRHDRDGRPRSHVRNGCRSFSASACRVG